MKRYTIEDKLGEGGMGVVFLARQTDLDRLVAIKYLRSQGELKEVDLARFKREMHVLMGLSHPNIIRVFDAGESEGTLFYVMELLEAYDLAELLRDQGPLACEPVAAVLSQVLDALDYIHGRKLIHRDIKPANIMLEEGGRAVLMDFGLVRKVDATMLTAQGKLLGTPRYFAPEYIMGEEVSPASDIWSLGVSAYELLSGLRPFLGETLKDLATAILKVEPEPLERVAAGTPPALASVVRRMLEKDPRRRYHDAAQCQRALKAAMPPDDLLRSAELSQQLSPELIRKLAGRHGTDPPPRPRVTGKSSRVTGRTARANVARPTGSRVPALPAAPVPAHRYWPAFVIVCAVVLLSGAVHLMRGPAAAPPVAAGAPLADPTADYRSAVELVVSFSTPDATVWTLDHGEGASVSDAAPTTAHHLVLAASPVRAPERLVLRSGTRTLEVRPPPSPLDRVRGLEKALANRNVEDKSTDLLWSQIRMRIPAWKVVNLVSIGGNVRAQGEGASPQIAQRAIKQDPSIASPYHSHVKAIREDPRVKRHLGAVLALAPGLLMNDRVPVALRDQLLSALFRLDRVDGLGEYMGLPPPFEVALAMRPAVEIAVQRLDKNAPVPAGLAPLYLPAPGKKGMVVHHTGEDFLSKMGGRLEPATGLEDSLGGWELAEKLKLGTAQPAGPGGRRLHFSVLGLSAQLFPYLVPKGYKHGFAIRLHGSSYGFQAFAYFQVTLRGPLAEPGYWDLTLRRFFQPSSRLYYGLTAVAVEPLP